MANHQQTNKSGRLKWTEKMNSDLLECKTKAVALTKSAEPPISENGRKKGYMRLMKEMWDDLGYENLALTPQNLRDQAARLMKTLGNVSSVIGEFVAENATAQSQNGESNMEISEDKNLQIDFNTDNEGNPDLHEECTQIEILEKDTIILNGKERDLLELSKQILIVIYGNEGDYCNRQIDTRTKEKPSQEDLKNINNVIAHLMKDNETSTTQNPFKYLWLINCILYSVVTAFLINKGWKKQLARDTQKRNEKRTLSKEKWKREYEKKVGDIRKMISIAKSELERLQENRKITRKGKRNRASIQRECENISASQLVGYMEKKKCELRKLKKGFLRRKKQEEARFINRQYKNDPGRVYQHFKNIITEDSTERPKYTEAKRYNNTGGEEETNLFESVEDASIFWRELWESEGLGDISTGWLAEVRAAIQAKVRIPQNGELFLSKEDVAYIMSRKKNWSAPGPDKLVNYWWKRAKVLHDGVTKCFKEITNTSATYPLWFCEGKITLIPKPGVFTSDNQRPITSLNTLHKWFTSCLLPVMNNHLQKYNLMEIQQRGAKPGCNGTMDNLLLDRIVTLDCYRGKRNLSMAWIDVKKAFDSVDHGWLIEMMDIHRFPAWLVKVVQKLCSSWNTKIAVFTCNGYEISDVIRFKKGLAQGDALCPRLFTLCLNPIAWTLRATEGYKLSKPIGVKITDLLYVDDLKVFAASENKLNRVLKITKTAMEDIGLKWNSKKCSVVHVKRGVQSKEATTLALDESAIIRSLQYYERL